MGIFDYLDTNLESPFRIKEARNNINKAAVILQGIGLFPLFCSLFFLLNNYFIFMNICWVLYISIEVTVVGLVIKREIYSIALIIKER